MYALLHCRFKKHFALLCLLSSFSLFAQPADPNDYPVYLDTGIARIDITVDPDSLAIIYDDVWSDHEYPASIVFMNGPTEVSIDTVGFRLRGNTSRVSAKKSFKVSFNSFRNGANLFGIEKLNLNGEHNDPSIIRAKVGWDLMRAAGVPASRANHIEVYINGIYYGLYISVEHIDENFLAARYASAGGNLYKCLWPADLTWLGGDPEAYKFMVGERRAYELKTNTTSDDYTRLRDLIEVLTQTTDEEFVTEIQKIFNVNDYLKVLAVEVCLGHWDAYWFNKNNFYLYDNPQTGKFDYIAYDLDNTFGIWWDGILPDTDWGTRNIYDWGHPEEDRPLADRILAQTIFRDRFTFYLERFISAEFGTTALGTRINDIHSLISTSAENDYYRTLDYGYSIDDFHASYNEALDGHVVYGLWPYIATRTGSALSQLIEADILPIISYPAHQPLYPGPQDPIVIQAHIEDNTDGLVASLHHRIDGVWQAPLPMFDDGASFDGGPGDGIYGVQLPSLGELPQIDYYISASDNSGQEILEPCDAPATTFTIGNFPNQPGLVINEFMASNLNSFADPFGEFDDWLEIYNADSATVWLGDKYLTDDLLNPLKWQFPDISLDPGEFLLIWADEDSSQGALHTNFKLAREGEQIGIFNGTDSAPIDTITYSLQSVDISFGRTVDGGGVWDFLPVPTPGFGNQSTGINPPALNIPGRLTLQRNYPNPFNGETVIDFETSRPGEVKLVIFNILGSQVRVLQKKTGLGAGRYSVRWDGRDDVGQDAASGIYFLRLDFHAAGDLRPVSAHLKLLLSK